MNTRITKFIIPFIIICFSCNNNNISISDIETIKIDLTKSDEYALFSKYDFLNLETSNECFLPSINKIIWQNDTIIIHSIEGNSIFLFSSDGSFITKYSIGSGPNELLYPIDITFDKKNNSLWILDSYRIIKEFALNGIQKKEIKVEDPYMRIGKIGDDLLLFDANLGRNNEYSFEFLRNGVSQKHVRKNELFKEIVYLPNSTFNNINDSTVYFYHQFEDIIYEWNIYKSAINPVYDLHFNPDRSITSYKEHGNLKANEYQKLYDNKENIFGIKNLYILEDYMFFTVEYKELFYCLYNKATKEIKICNKLISGLPSTRNIYGCTDSSILFIITPEELSEFLENNKNEATEKNLELASHSKFDDNPIIIKLDVF